MVRDSYQRDVARSTPADSERDTFEDIPMPDYTSGDQVQVDVITLDSGACAPCMYMVDAAKRGAARAGTGVAVREHKITTREGLAYMTRLGVENIPTICIDGEVAFASVIPDIDTLSARFEQARREKAE